MALVSRLFQSLAVCTGCFSVDCAAWRPEVSPGRNRVCEYAKAARLRF